MTAPAEGNHPDQVLVDAALSRNPDAVRTLVRRLTPAIQARAAHLLIRAGGARQRDIRHAVADLTQEVFVALLANEGRVLRAWAPQGGATLETFVSVVAQRHVVSILRSRRRTPLQWDTRELADLESEPADQSPIDASVCAKQHVIRVADALVARLSPLGMEMFYGLFVLEETVIELAARTGQSVDSVYQWRCRLRKLIQNLSADIADASDAEGAPLQPVTAQRLRTSPRTGGQSPSSCHGLGSTRVEDS